MKEKRHLICASFVISLRPGVQGVPSGSTFGVGHDNRRACQTRRNLLYALQKCRMSVSPRKSQCWQGFLASGNRRLASWKHA